MQPIFSTDEHGATKFKMERYLQPGQNAIATVYAPITYSPVPLIAFQRDPESGEYSIAATGTDSIGYSHLKVAGVIIAPCHTSGMVRIVKVMNGCALRSRAFTYSNAGSLRSCDPDRVILKRIVLSGYPVRVHKKKAVVRWMFHQPDDVRWFRPLDLWTKHGLRGRIKVFSSPFLLVSILCRAFTCSRHEW